LKLDKDDEEEKFERDFDGGYSSLWGQNREKCGYMWGQNNEDIDEMKRFQDPLHV
jgi:hypothetical protein